jgi:hypothetical protein
MPCLSSGYRVKSKHEIIILVCNRLFARRSIGCRDSSRDDWIKESIKRKNNYELKLGYSLILK